MAQRVFVSGSSDGLGLATARALIDEGAEVVVHARSQARAAGLREALPDAADVLVADLASREQTFALAEQANALGRFDAVIHNAGVGFREPRRVPTPEGHAHVLAVNVLAPYILTALMHRPDRLVYLSSGMHSWGDPDLGDVDWLTRRWDGAQAYSDSKLLDTALCFALARRWPEVICNSVSPGWVATKMGGAGAPDDLALAHVTQVWLALSDAAAAMRTGRLLKHQEEIAAAPAARDEAFQESLLSTLTELTGVVLDGAERSVGEDAWRLSA